MLSNGEDLSRFQQNFEEVKYNKLFLRLEYYDHRNLIVAILQENVQNN
jgi:hypothetical protein